MKLLRAVSMILGLGAIVLTGLTVWRNIESITNFSVLWRVVLMWPRTWYNFLFYIPVIFSSLWVNWMLHNFLSLPFAFVSPFLAYALASHLHRSRFGWFTIAILFPFFLILLAVLPDKGLSWESRESGTRCAKCKQARRKGAFYTFYYGKALGKPWRVPSSSSLEKKYVQTYLIGGSKQAWICTGCLIEGIVRSEDGIGVAAIVAVVYSLGLALNSWIVRVGGDPLLCVGLVLASSIGYLLYYNIDAIAVCGDDQAIRVYRSELEAGGYDTFFNRREYRRLGQHVQQ